MDEWTSMDDGTCLGELKSWRAREIGCRSRFRDRFERILTERESVNHRFSSGGWAGILTGIKIVCGNASGEGFAFLLSGEVRLDFILE
jgi:hypothetical protein